MTRQQKRLHDSLISACNDEPGIAGKWLEQAKSALNQGQSLADFTAHCHPDNRKVATLAYKLAVTVNPLPQIP